MKLLTPVVLLLLNACFGAQAFAKSSEGFVKTNERISIHYLSSGKHGARHSLLLVPGWRVSSIIWSKQMESFEALGYRVIAIDSRSQGQSAVVDMANAPEDRAEDIDQVISKLHLEHLILVGWSQGVQDVAAYVNQFGTRSLEGIVLIDSAVSAGSNDVDRNPAGVEKRLQGIASYSRDPKSYSEGMMHVIISTPTPSKIYDTLVSEAVKTPTDIGISMLIQDLYTVDRRAALEKFDKPTLVIASGKSPQLDDQRQMAAKLTNGQFKVIANAAHAVCFDQPEDCNQLIASFIAGIGTSGARTP